MRVVRPMVIGFLTAQLFTLPGAAAWEADPDGLVAAGLIGIPANARASRSPAEGTSPHTAWVSLCRYSTSVDHAGTSRARR